MAFQPLAILSSLVSGLFGGMASRAFRERKYANAQWLSRISERLALHPYTKMSVMAVLANSELRGKKSPKRGDASSAMHWRYAARHPS